MADISGYLQNIRNGARGEDVRDSIINALDKINKDNPAIVRPLNVTANGTYAGEGGIVYNPVTVNVPEGASQALSLTDINITENGEFTPGDGEAYRNITVEVPQYVNEIMQDEKVVYLEEGDKVYYALDDGYDGYSAVHVMSGSGGGGGGTKYYVDFLNPDGSLLERVMDVPFGGGAVCHKPNPTSPAMRFVGWSPNPLNVRSNMTCYPRFENINWDETQISDDWITIAKKIEANPDAYNVGQWKYLELNAWTDADGNTKTARMVKMQLVAKGVDQLEGENGYAATTWLIPLDKTSSQMRLGNGDVNGLTSDDVRGWPGSAARRELQSTFTQQAFPQDLLRYIKRVVKTCSVLINASTQTAQMATDYQTIEWFFVPSIREVCGACTDYLSLMDTQGIYGEKSGPVYSEAFGGGDTVTNLASRRASYRNWETRSFTRVPHGYCWDVENNGWTYQNVLNYAAKQELLLCFCI